MELALKYDLHACTDITGFGILGHLLEIAHGSNSRIVIRYRDLPFYAGALAMYKKGETTGSNKANRAMVKAHFLTMDVALGAAEDELLYDPQTSGGLLLSLPAAQAVKLLAELIAVGIPAVNIGEVTGEPVGITVI
jgi:selenide,water dikinase